MKVIYEDSITEKINLAIDKAKSDGKKIKEIEVTSDEFEELVSGAREILSHSYFSWGHLRHGYGTGQPKCIYREVKVFGEALS